jgi:DNA repair exonuclease SbcCD ATPase subunit
MSATDSVQRAHDFFLRDGSKHVDCPLCVGDEHFTTEEVAQVADDTGKNVYTEDQHFALLETAVARETASMASEKAALESTVETLTAEKAALEATVAESASRVDVLEAEKATAEASAEAARQELTDFKAELARKEQVESLKAERADRVKAAAPQLEAAYFTQERVTRWAEMSEETFESLVTDMTEAAAATPKPVETKNDEQTEQARETAAFSGGEPVVNVEGSTLGRLLRAKRSA